LPDPRGADKRGLTGPQGEFLINFVPAPFPYRDYLILVRADGYSSLVIDQARVLPGAVMALGWMASCGGAGDRAPCTGERTPRRR